MASVAVCVKDASISGEQQFVARIFMRDTVSGSVYCLYVAEIRINKDLYDSMSAGHKTEFDSVTLGVLVTAAYGVTDDVQS